MQSHLVVGSGGQSVDSFWPASKEKVKQSLKGETEISMFHHGRNKTFGGPSKLGIKKASPFKIFAAQLNCRVQECIWLKKRKSEQTSTNGLPIMLVLIMLFGNSSMSYSMT